MLFTNDIMYVTNMNEENDKDRKVPFLDVFTCEKTVTKSQSGFGTRHQMAFLAFLGLFNFYAFRANLSLTVVAMVNRSTSDLEGNETTECPNHANKSEALGIEVGEFNWDEKTQGMLLSSFFYGYILTQIPGGRLAERFGTKIIIGLGILMSSICTLVTPVLARLHIWALVAVRVLLGISQGFVTPSMHSMIGKWIPNSEITFMALCIYGGATVGLVVSMPISGALCDSDFLGGWPSVYYVFGIIGCIWCILWFMFAYDSPAEHPRITETERTFIEHSTGVKKKNLPTPYKSILTSPAVLAICVAHMAHGWGTYTIMACLPLYMNRIQNFDTTQNGIMMAALYVICWLFSISIALLADFIRRQRCLSTVTTRKLYNSIGSLFAALFLVLIKQAGCNQIAVIALLVLSTSVSMFCDCGYAVNHIDIAPNFAGTLMGITNTLSTASGMLAPYVAGVLTENNQTMAQWQIVFYISAGFYAFGGVFFLIFARGVVQRWNDPNASYNITVEEPTDTILINTEGTNIQSNEEDQALQKLNGDKFKTAR